MIKTEQAIKYFTRPGDTRTAGITTLADTFGVARTSIYAWGKFVPDAYQGRLHLLTAGALDSGIRPVKGKSKAA